LYLLGYSGGFVYHARAQSRQLIGWSRVIGRPYSILKIQQNNNLDEGELLKKVILKYYHNIHV